MSYRIGLDVGIASVGWCAMQTDENGEPCRILDLGTRIFNVAEVPKTGASLAAPRREARGVRRRLRRRGDRLQYAKNLFVGELNKELLPSEQDVNLLRYLALDNKISENDFANVLLMLTKRRGFKSNRKSGTPEEGKLLQATKQNNAMMAEKGYRTIGEMFYKEFSEMKNGKLIFNTRNKGGNYERNVLRSDLEKEIKLLFQAQRNFGNALAKENIEEKFLTIFNKQRNFDEGPGPGSPYSASYNVGLCQFNEYFKENFNKDEERAPKASYTFERNMVLQKLNNLRIVTARESKDLTIEQRGKLLLLIEKKWKTKSAKITFANLRKELDLFDDERFNLLNYSSDDLNKCEKADFAKMDKSAQILYCLNEENKTRDIADQIAFVLSHAKSDDKRQKMIAENEILQTLSNEEIEKVLSLNFEKFGHLSIKALKMIEPYLEQGKKYSDACAMAGFNHSKKTTDKTKLLNTKNIRNQVNEITSPVVKRSISQTIKVLNALIRKYGSPVAINVEMAREMSKNHDERKKIQKSMEDNFKDRTKAKNLIFEEFNHYATSDDILKYRLYEEQKGKCPYSGQKIDIDRLFESNYTQIDHINPYSRSFDNSWNNKVLVLAKQNQDKRNQTPYEWLFTTDRWNDYVERICIMYGKKFKKQKNLLSENFNEKDWKERALNDTKYISRFMLNLLQNHLEFDENFSGKKRVFAVNGRITSIVRWNWGIKKIREDGDLHHAVDAAVIACITDAQINKISKLFKTKENYETNIDVEDLKEPYKNFVNELRVRCMEDKEQIKERLPQFGYAESEIENIKPVFVSRMPRRKAVGAIHADTIRSGKYLDDGIVVSKVSIQKLKLENSDSEFSVDGKAIKNYFNPQDDKKTYFMLLEKLIQSNGDGEIAFKDKVFKPCADGKIGNEIKKVKIFDKSNAGVQLKNKGFADNANGSMIRIDIFEKAKKFYCVPIYTDDLYKGKMPNLAPIAGKKKCDWQVIDETFDFKFSLYPNDLIFIKHKKGIKMGRTKENENSRMDEAIEFIENYLYYKAFGINTASASLNTHNNCYIGNIGLKTLEKIEKCQVDVLGNVSFVKNEKRMPLNKK